MKKSLKAKLNYILRYVGICLCFSAILYRETNSLRVDSHGEERQNRFFFWGGGCYYLFILFQLSVSPIDLKFKVCNVCSANTIKISLHFTFFYTPWLTDCNDQTAWMCRLILVFPVHIMSSGLVFFPLC